MLQCRDAGKNTNNAALINDSDKSDNQIEMALKVFNEEFYLVHG